jgi:hypothetical protein
VIARLNSCRSSRIQEAKGDLIFGIAVCVFTIISIFSIESTSVFYAPSYSGEFAQRAPAKLR